MNKPINNNSEHITVIPYYPHCHNYHREVNINTLYFWHNNTYEHPVTDELVVRFLLHVKMYGASVFPECPELGCLAVNGGELAIDQGEVSVSQICYKGEVIWCRS